MMKECRDGRKEGIKIAGNEKSRRKAEEKEWGRVSQVGFMPKWESKHSPEKLHTSDSKNK